MGEMKLSPVHPAHSHSAGYPFVVSAPRVGSSGLWSLAPSTNILAWWAARLAAVFGSLGTRGSLSFFCSLGWLLWMLYRPLLVIRCHLQPGRRQEPPQQL